MRLFVAIVIMVLILRFWVLRKRALFYNGADLRICVENVGVFGRFKDVSACLEKGNKNFGKKVFSLMIDRI